MRWQPPGDLLFHIRAHRFDVCFELAERLTERLGGACASVVDEVHGFRSFDERDVLGFVDGTENPEGAGRGAAVLIGDEDPDFAGGSYVVVQKYVHDLSAVGRPLDRGAGADRRAHQAHRTSSCRTTSSRRTPISRST